MTGYERVDEPSAFDPDAGVEALLDGVADERVWVESGLSYGDVDALDRWGDPALDVETEPLREEIEGGEFERVVVEYGDETYRKAKRSGDCLGLDAETLATEGLSDEAVVARRDAPDDVNVVTTLGRLLDRVESVEAVELHRDEETATVDLADETVGYFHVDTPTYPPEGPVEGERTEVRLLYDNGRTNEFTAGTDEPTVSPPVEGEWERESGAPIADRLGALRGATIDDRTRSRGR